LVDINATLIAQILNFIILLAILAKFCYKPIIKVLDDRRNRIIKDLDSAEQTHKEADALKAQYAKQLTDARTEAASIVEKANKVGQKLHDDLVAQAQTEKEQMMKNAQEHIEQEKQQALLDVRTQVITLATQIAGKIVDEKLNGPEDQKLISKNADAVLGTAK
jgi:F-type H+-transporting ATPase subunit b